MSEAAALVHEPVHLFTMGWFGGEYGISTRGLLVCPDIVPRFPAIALVTSMDPGALVLGADLPAPIQMRDPHGEITEPDAEMLRFRLSENPPSAAPSPDISATTS